MSVETNRALALEFVTLVAKGDVDGAAALLSDDACIWNPTGEKSKAEFVALLNGAMAVFAGPMEPQFLGSIAEGDRVAIELKSSVRLKNGGTYANDYCFVFRIADGVITRVSEYADSAPAVAAFGGQQ